MKEKRISFCQGKGSLTHNNREFIAENIDRNRIRDNVTFIRQDLGKAYDQLFAESTERYNAKQKRNDRKIHGTYYESLFHQKPSNTVVTAADKRKSFYEDVVQIGKMDDSGVGTEDAELVAECLKEYMKDFQSRNPNFYVFNADNAVGHVFRQRRKRRTLEECVRIHVPALDTVFKVLQHHHGVRELGTVRLGNRLRLLPVRFHQDGMQRLSHRRRRSRILLYLLCSLFADFSVCKDS